MGNNCFWMLFTLVSFLFFLTQILFLCTHELLVISCSRWIGSQTQFLCLFFTTTPQSALIQLNPYVYSVGKLLVLISLCSGRTSQHQLLTAGSLFRLRGRGRRVTAATYVISVTTVIHTMGMYSVLKGILAVCHFFNSSCCLFIYCDVFLDAAYIVSLNEGYKN